MHIYTRKELVILGISSYQAKKLTNKIKPVAQKGRAKAYSAESIIPEIDALISTPGTRKATRITLRILRSHINPNRKSIAEIAQKNAEFSSKKCKQRSRLQAENALIEIIGADQFYILEPV
jgi:hypothetical protein